MPISLVTGAGVRVGAAIARALVDAGHDVILHANRSTSGADAIAAWATEQGRTAHVVSADLSTSQGVEHLAQFTMSVTPHLDALVHNAAVFERRAFKDVTRQAYRHTMAVNLDAPFFLTQALLPCLHEGTNPCVIMVGDVTAHRPIIGYPDYGVSKAAVLMLMRVLARELAPRTRANAVSPGTVVFPDDYDDEAREKILSRIPLVREGRAVDVARAVLFLIEERYLNGVNIPVDGGRSIVF